MSAAKGIRTQKAALAEAARRWGKAAAIQYDGREPLGGRESVNPKTGKVWAKHWRCRVGHTAMGGMFFMLRGEGDTWEAAFADADRREASLGRPAESR